MKMKTGMNHDEKQEEDHEKKPKTDKEGDNEWKVLHYFFGYMTLVGTKRCKASLNSSHKKIIKMRDWATPQTTNEGS
ncbi:hypothetical protein MKW98_021689 [Papaver atlanticum]|uniref:Uncharacterized protein n=1 Tax=Papaver atlanticum TaxID=357466 RepID=A0AAD4S2U4_9MAGN|nr:hypothetical protein MKW98_021689 [Papaver atlanticum]